MQGSLNLCVVWGETVNCALEVLSTQYDVGPAIAGMSFSQTQKLLKCVCVGGVTLFASFCPQVVDCSAVKIPLKAKAEILGTF